MKLHQKSILILLLFLSTISGCSDRVQSTSTELEEKFQISVPIADMNKSLRLNIEGDEKTFRRGSDIPLLFQNRSPHFIFFTAENYIKLFMTRDAEWIEVKNELTYSGNKALSPQGTPLLDLDHTWARPALDDNAFKDNKTEILTRIVMTGEIMENDKPTGDLVGAYVDVYLTP